MMFNEAIVILVEGKQNQFYLFVDEIQMSDPVPNPYNADGKKITFYDALNDLKGLANLDVYVTGSNSKMLSSDILTEFRGRSDEIRMHPLSFAEYYAAAGGDKNEAFDDYAFYGGMPLILSRPTEAAKMNYLRFIHSLSALYAGSARTMSRANLKVDSCFLRSRIAAETATG